MRENRFRTRNAAALCVLLTALLFPGILLAQAVPDGDAIIREFSGSMVAQQPATLVIANRPVFVFRATSLGISPEGRAMGARIRVQTVLEGGGPTAVDAREIPEGILITVGGEGVFRILRNDFDPESDDTLQSLSMRTTATLRQVLAEESELRSLPRLLRSVGWAALDTLVFLISIWLLASGARWLVTRLERLALRGVDRIKLGGFTSQYSEKVVATARRAVAVVKWGVWLVAGYIWLALLLSLFPYTRPWGEGLDAYLISLAAGVATAVADAVPGLVLVTIIVIVTRSVSRGAGLFFRAVQQGTVSVTWVHPDTAEATRRIVTVVLWLFALALSYPYLPGSSSDAFKGVSVFAGLMISLGSTTVVGQILSGFIIIYARTFRPGDYIRVGETEGVVQAIGLFATKIDNMKRERVSIPNSVILGTEVKNYSRPSGELSVILYTSVTIGYNAPWRQVHAMLLQAADRTPGLLKTPVPFVNQTSLSDFYVEYQLNAHLEVVETRMRTLAALHASIQDVFNEHGVQIMSPHYEMDPAAPVVVPRENWFTPPARPE